MVLSRLLPHPQVTALALITAFFLAGPYSNGRAQEKKTDRAAPGSGANISDPVVVVTLASINKLMQDVNYITSVVGQPQAGGMFSMLAGGFTQGIDMNSPIGILVPLVNGLPEPIAMVPTADVKVVLKRLEAQIGPADELEDGSLAISIGASVVYVRQSGNWAVLARNREVLAAAPADPSPLFQGLGNNYDIAFRLKMQLVPPATREMLVDQIRQGFEGAMRNQQGADEGNREVAEASIKQIEKLVQETDELMFGWNIEQAQRQTVIDASFTALPGTDLAEMHAGHHSIPSRFASVLKENAAMYYHVATSTSPKLVEQTRTSMATTLSAIKNALSRESNLSPEQAADVQDLIDRISELAISSISEGKSDIGGLLLAEANKMQFVFGVFVSDGDKAATIVNDVARKLEKDANAPKFKFNTATYKDVAMHEMRVAIPPKADEARKIFGETAVLHIGTAPKAVYLAIGKDVDALLKQFIDSGATDNGAAGRPIGQMRVQLLPILEYIQSIEANDGVGAMLDALSRAPDQGLITVVQDSIPNGQKSQIVIAEGMLQAIGAAARNAQMKRMQQQGGNGF